ncbi:hypothetical protein V8J88_15010 [Massilia sp. W12]|uniref:hypothetical protein n=1 Tax=Massilia sp. W12 TaxID=3126507 RepID=UPI0030D53856
MAAEELLLFYAALVHNEFKLRLRRIKPGKSAQRAGNNKETLAFPHDFQRGAGA